MSRLTIKVPFHDGEATSGYASRLAAANGVDGSDFGALMEIGWLPLLYGKEDALFRLSSVCGIDVSTLSRGFVRPDSSGTAAAVQINGEQLTKAQVLRWDPRYCPQCVREDIATSTGAVEARPYQRLDSLVTFIRTCEAHDVMLRRAEPVVEYRHRRDFARRIKFEIIEGHLDAAPVVKRHTAFERYIASRLHGRVTDTPWMDGMPLHVVGRMCEVVGGAELFGFDFKFRALSEEDWVDAAARGFEIMSRGEVGFVEFLYSLHGNFWKSSADFGGRSVYGTLYVYLQANPDPGYDSIRNIMKDIALDNFPLGPGDDFFGTVTCRRVHSVRTGSLISRFADRTLHKLLIAAGLVDPATKGTNPNKVLINGDRMETFIRGADDLLVGPAAREYLGISLSTWKSLLADGFIQPCIRSASGENVKSLFRRSDLDDFASKLEAQVTAPLASRTSFISLPTAASRVHRPITEVLNFLLAGKLKYVAKAEVGPRFQAICLDLEELRDLVRLTPLPGHNLRTVEKLLNTTTPVVRKLISNGHLAAETAINPGSKTPQVVVRPEVLEAFAGTFISLHNIAIAQNTNIKAVRRDLVARGILPAIDGKDVGATFYRMKDLDPKS
ncbi:hypothetical protein GOD74_23675 [Sinorhizobium medicae]|nr:hypothetical protein [Sinorhizobium medicae]